MNEEWTTTMDDRMCRSLFSTQPVAKNKIFCEKMESILSGIQDALDRPLDTFTAENVRKTTEQIQAALKALCRLLSETMQESIPFYDAVIRGLQQTIVELTLALDQLSPPENKASFYTHLLLSQGYFAAVFVHDLSDVSRCMHANTDTAPINILTFSSQSRSLLDFSCTILSDMYPFIQTPGPICSTQYEQAVANLQTLDELLEKQKKLFKVSQYYYDNECATLCCRLSVVLSYASELLRRLIYSLSTLQMQTRPKSRRMAQLREEALSSLTLFIHTFDDICQKTQELKLLQTHMIGNVRRIDDHAKQKFTEG